MAVRETKPGRPDGWFKLGRRWRKTVLVTHIVSAGAWIGIDVMVAVLVLTGRFGSSDEVRGLAYEALATFVVWPMLGAGSLSLITGIILGLGTRWGLVRYWWVAIKLVLNIVLCTLILVALRPGMDEVGAYGRDLVNGAPEPAGISNLFFPPAVSLVTLTLATVLAVAKPWGRIRRTSRARRSAGTGR
ncbi:hypothetical protein E1287_36495 [Actinomadura sp. KC06]|uniref:hypothetical protein n=1 Tax=Actinomadura sp. KC06 TaxID=2530369 RepID=UPI001052F874|nr:hypothetical protein [Actinomadura sp. KC06]TDD26319.1 hypothetical protein E1287_36495 [Actinomadura sp. KC06]